MSRRSPYDVLQVQPHAQADVIAVVYRHLAKRYHPDRDPSPDAAARMAELNEAYAILGDVEKRARYDASAGYAERGARDPGVGEVPPGDPASQARRGDPRFGEAGPPPSSPPASGRPLSFGRYRGWALNQVQRRDPDYLEWLARTPMGRTHREELDELVRRRR
jgi:curved DNA-binding protein CbpA